MRNALEIVSRETLDRLDVFAELVKKWNPKINLISKASISEIWPRHIMDSAQVFDIANIDSGHWVDLGSGGGFPGIVVAIIAKELAPGLRVSLVESDARKCAFLRTAIREFGIEASVFNERIEALEPLGADILTSRALADLTTLLMFAEMHLSTGGTALFHKGARWKEELGNAQSKWKFSSQAVKSTGDSNSAILKISGISRV